MVRRKLWARISREGRIALSRTEGDGAVHVHAYFMPEVLTDVTPEELETGRYGITKLYYTKFNGHIIYFMRPPVGVATVPLKVTNQCLRDEGALYLAKI